MVRSQTTHSGDQWLVMSAAEDRPAPTLHAGPLGQRHIFLLSVLDLQTDFLSSEGSTLKERESHRLSLPSLTTMCGSGLSLGPWFAVGISDSAGFLGFSELSGHVLVPWFLPGLWGSWHCLALWSGGGSDMAWLGEWDLQGGPWLNL